jgi:hypothetical protein
MLRDVSALDRQQLATIELGPAPWTLRVVARRLSGSVTLLLDKHARLMIRRYPMAGLAGFVIAATLTIASFSAPQAIGLLVPTITVAFAYAVVLNARLHRAPVEQPRLLASLPFSGAQVRAAARAYVSWWWCLFVTIPVGLVVIRSPMRWQVALLLLVETVGLLALGMRSGDPPSKGRGIGLSR